MRDQPAAFWSRTPGRPNFGDALTPWIIRELTGDDPLFRLAEDPRHKYLVTGSIVARAGRACTVWGAGIMDWDDQISPEAEFRAVRGPLTRANAIGHGADCPPVFGDPALLLPRLYSPTRSTGVPVGLASHFSERGALDRRALPPSMCLVDMQSPIEDVIDLIVSCDVVAATSLHGIIVAHAYGVPAVWLSFGRLPSGDGSKFRDYFAAIGRRGQDPLEVCPADLDVDQLLAHVIEPPEFFDLDPLWDSCPFRGS